MKVRPQEHLFVRRVGLSVCINFDMIYASTLGTKGQLSLFGNSQRAVAILPPPLIAPAGYGYPWQCAPGQILHPSGPASVPILNTCDSAMSLVPHGSAMSLASSDSAMLLSSDLIPTADSVQSNLSRMSIHVSRSDLEKLNDSDGADPALGNYGGLSAGSSMLADGSVPPALPQRRLPPVSTPLQCQPTPSGAELAPWSFMTPSPVGALVHTTAMPPPLPTLAFDDLDQLWQYNRVHIPTTRRPWPAGIYARDMARAFQLIDDGITDGGPKDLATRFTYVFQGIPFKSATYQSQRSAWVNSTQAQRDEAMSKPRTHDGLWTECRMKLDGWKAMRGHKRGQGKYCDE